MLAVWILPNKKLKKSTFYKKYVFQRFYKTFHLPSMLKKLLQLLIQLLQLTHFTLRANIALKGVHLYLNSLVFSFCLSRFPPVDYKNYSKQQKKTDCSSCDACNGFRWNCIWANHLVAEVSNRKPKESTDSNLEQKIKINQYFSSIYSWQCKSNLFFTYLLSLQKFNDFYCTVKDLFGRL